MCKGSGGSGGGGSRPSPVPAGGDDEGDVPTYVQVPEGGLCTYTIRSGDTYKALAKAFCMKGTDLWGFNPGTVARLLQPGQVRCQLCSTVLLPAVQYCSAQCH